MKNKLTKIIVAVLTLAFAGSLVAAPAFADDPFCKDGMGSAAQEAMGCKKDQRPMEVIVIDIIKVIIGALGIVAVIFIIIGGVRYMTSSGDVGKIKTAKDTILYAVIGLAICALSFAIVNFAASIINGDKTPEETNKNTSNTVYTDHID